jgi:hypothetical protein
MAFNPEGDRAPYSDLPKSQACGNHWIVLAPLYQIETSVKVLKKSVNTKKKFSLIYWNTVLRHHQPGLALSGRDGAVKKAE